MTNELKSFTPRAGQRSFLRVSLRGLPEKLEYMNLAEQLEDLKVPPGNRLHPLYGARRGQHVISINDQWRICFRFEDGDAYEVGANVSLLRCVLLPAVESVICTNSSREEE